MLAESIVDGSSNMAGYITPLSIPGDFETTGLKRDFQSPAPGAGVSRCPWFKSEARNRRYQRLSNVGGEGLALEARVRVWPERPSAHAGVGENGDRGGPLAVPVRSCSDER